MNHLTGLNLILWYIGVTLEKYLDHLPRLGLILWFIFVGLEKHLKQLTGLRLILLQPEMLLEKSENLLGLSVKQLVIQSSLESLISLGQAVFGEWKTKC